MTDLSRRLPVINNTTDMSEGLPVINNTINLGKKLSVIKNTSAKMTYVVNALCGYSLSQYFEILCGQKPNLLGQ